MFVHAVGGPSHGCIYPHCLEFVGQRVQQQNCLSTPDLSEVLAQLNVYNMRLQALTVATTHAITELLPNVQCFSFKSSS